MGKKFTPLVQANIVEDANGAGTSTSSAQNQPFPSTNPAEPTNTDDEQTESVVKTVMLPATFETDQASRPEREVLLPAAADAVDVDQASPLSGYGTEPEGENVVEAASEFGAEDENEGKGGGDESGTQSKTLREF